MSVFSTFVNSILPAVLSAFWKLVMAVVILLVGHFLIKFAHKKFTNHHYKKPVDPGLIGFLCTVIKIALYILLIYVIHCMTQPCSERFSLYGLFFSAAGDRR